MESIIIIRNLKEGKEPPNVGLAHFIHRFPQGSPKKMKKGIGDVRGEHSPMNVPLGHPSVLQPLSNFFTLRLIFWQKIHVFHQYDE